MNYDGLALVVDCDKQIFKSVNGSCDVLAPLEVPNPLEYNSEVSIWNTNVIPQYKEYIAESYIIDDTVIHGVTPITVNVVSSLENNIKFYPIMVQSLCTGNKFNKQCDVNCEFTVPISVIDRANVISKKFAVTVIDKSSEERNIVFPYTSVNVTDKTQITVPDTSELTGFTIVLQKNNFVYLLHGVIEMPESHT